MNAKHVLSLVMIVVSSLSLAQIPEYWFLDEVNPGQDISLYPDGANVQDGTFSCMMTLEQPEVPYLISDNFEVTAGTEYTFSIYYFDNDARGTLKFYADFYDAQGDDIYGEDPVESVDADEWQEVTWTGTVPAGAVHGYILVKFYDDEGYVDEAIGWVDNVHFIVGEENLVMNGSFESWPGVGIGEEHRPDQVHVYPNPVVDVVEVTHTQDADRVEVLNMLGQVVLSEELDGSPKIRLDVSEMLPGLYFVSTKKGNEMLGSAKILKQ